MTKPEKKPVQNLFLYRYHHDQLGDLILTCSPSALLQIKMTGTSSSCISSFCSTTNVEQSVRSAIRNCSDNQEQSSPGSIPACADPADSEFPEVLQETIAWLDVYFKGQIPPEFPVMELEGTPFQKLVWNLLLQIPYGSTTCYQDLAAQAAAAMGKEQMSAQAIGQAVGANPIAILVPCHRVIGKNRNLHGYAYGLPAKQYLLDLEKADYTA